MCGLRACSMASILQLGISLKWHAHLARDFTGGTPVPLDPVATARGSDTASKVEVCFFSVTLWSLCVSVVSLTGEHFHHRGTEKSQRHGVIFG